jgi:hypothetical protein
MFQQGLLLALLFTMPGGWESNPQAQKVGPGSNPTDGVVDQPVQRHAPCGRRRRRKHGKCGQRQTAARPAPPAPANTNGHKHGPTTPLHRRYNPDLNPPEKAPTPGVRPPASGAGGA